MESIKMYFRTSLIGLAWLIIASLSHMNDETKKYIVSLSRKCFVHEQDT